MPSTPARSLIVALCVAAAACGGDGPTDPNGDNGGDGGNGGDARVILDSPSFAQNVYESFQRRGCNAASCHGGSAGGLSMSSASVAYEQLVGVPSAGTGELRVIANDAANSYLVKKLEGTQGAGAQMPLGGTPLDNIDLTNVKNWINQGATNN
jgi:hypothetical protein